MQGSSRMGSETLELMYLCILLRDKKCEVRMMLERRRGGEEGRRGGAYHLRREPEGAV